MVRKPLSQNNSEMLTDIIAKLRQNPNGNIWIILVIFRML